MDEDGRSATYGECLGELWEAILDAAKQLEQAEPPTVNDLMAAAIARTQAYQAMHRQAVIIAGGEHPLTKALQRATTRSGGELPEPPASTAGSVVALQKVSGWAGRALEILESHVTVDQAGQRVVRSLTPEGAATLAGFERAENLARVAFIATRLLYLDEAYLAWTAPYRVAVTTYADVGMTTTGPLEHIAQRHGSRQPGSTLLATLSGATATRPDLVGSIESPRDCIAAVDAGRAWLHQQRRRLGHADLTVVLQTGVIFSDVAVYLTDTLIPGRVHGTKQLASSWLAAASGLRKLLAATPDTPTVGRAALLAAADWLTAQVGRYGEWHAPEQFARGSNSEQIWRDFARELAARLPDLVAHAYHAATIAIDRRVLLYQPQPQHDAAARSSSPLRPTTSADAPAAQVIGNLLVALSAAQEIARLAGVQPRQGLLEAEGTTRPMASPAPKPPAVFNAGRGPSWYSQTDRARTAAHWPPNLPKLPPTSNPSPDDLGNGPNTDQPGRGPGLDLES
jgi:hypothetical protein